MAYTADASFTQGSLLRHVSVMSFTTSVGLMAIYVVDLLDLFFISMLGQAPMAAAAGYASALMFFASAINIGLSVAAGTLVAWAQGAGREDEARGYATSVAVFAAITRIVLPFDTPHPARAFDPAGRDRRTACPGADLSVDHPADDGAVGAVDDRCRRHPRPR